MKYKYSILISSLLFAFILYSCGSDDEMVNTDIPTISNLAINNPSSSSCELPCNLSFSASSQLSFPENAGDQVSYNWNFGDGSAEVSGNKIMHEYTTVGEHVISLTAKAPGASDVIITQSFTVSPNSTFIATSRDADRGYDILEVSDGFIVFGFDKLLKFDKQGNSISTVEGASFLTDYSHGDFHELEGTQDGFILVSANGNYASVDNNLEFENPINYDPTQRYVNAIVIKFGELYFLGAFSGSFEFVDAPLFINLLPETYPSIQASGYTQISGQPISLSPKHIQIGNSYFMPVRDIDYNSVLYGVNEGNAWLTPVIDYDIQSISDGQNNNILTLGTDEYSTLELYEVDKTSGALGQKIDICEESFPGGLLKVSDGFIIVTVVPEWSTCLSGQTIEGFNDIRIQKMDFQYNTIWDNIINISNSQSVREIKQALDGGFLITGTTRLNGENNLFLVKTDPEGRVN